MNTIYIADARGGHILEGSAPDPSVANNCYKHSKAQAERLLLMEAGLRTRVMHPSIVIGHSRTRYGVNWFGMYSFARLLLRFHTSTDRKLSTFLSHVRVRLLVDPEAKGNTITVGFVARNAVYIGLSGSSHTFFYLTNTTVPTVHEGAKIIMDLIGRRELLWMRDREGFTFIDAAVTAGMSFYCSYLNHDKQFDASNTDVVCGPESSCCPISRAETEECVLYFLRDKREFGSVTGAPARVVHPAIA